MIPMLSGFAVAAALWWGLKAFGSADPGRVSRLLKQGGGVAALIVAGILLLRGRWDMAALLGAGAAWLFGWAEAPAIVGRIAATLGRPGPGAVRARSRFVEIWRDPDGHLRGRVLAGPLKGRSLGGLDASEQALLREACLADDPEGIRLIEAYRDGGTAGRREDAQADDDPRRRSNPQPGAMSQEEAHQILGLQPGAGSDAVRASHRALMKKLHPDQGGTTYLASRINQARDILLDLHR